MFLFLSILLAAPPAPLAADNPVADLGERFIGQSLVHTFQLVNNGAASIEIKEVGVTCGCMTPKLDERTVKPGQVVPLTVEVNTLSQPAGPLAWRVRINYTAGGQPHEAALEMRSQLVGEIQLQPATLVFSSGGNGRSHLITLIDSRPKPMTVTGVGATSSKVQAELLPAEGGDAGVRLVRVSVAADCPPGKHAEALVLTTNDPKYRELKLPVTINQPAKTSVSAFPGMATVSSFESPLLQLRDRDNRPVVVHSISVDGPLTTKWSAGPGPFSTVRVSLDPQKWDKKPMRGSIRVTLQEPAKETIVVPVQISGAK